MNKFFVILLTAVFALFSVNKAEAQIQLNPTEWESTNISNIGWLHYGPQESDGTILIHAILFSYGETPTIATIKGFGQSYDVILFANFEEGLAAEGAPVHLFFPTIPPAEWEEVYPGQGSPDRVFEAVIAVSTPGDHVFEIEYMGPQYYTRLRFEFPLWYLQSYLQ